MAKAWLVSGICGLVALAAPETGLAQAQGDFPATILCDPLPVPSGVLRDTLRVEILDGRASYSRRMAGGGSESGNGALVGRVLTLIGAGKGQGFSYSARYSGEVGGRGGTLTGRQTWSAAGKSYIRACQMVLGDGR